MHTVFNGRREKYGAILSRNVAIIMGGLLLNNDDSINIEDKLFGSVFIRS